MKNIYKLFLALALVLGVSSCQESDLYVDELLDTVGTYGVVLRTLQAPADLVNNTSITSIDIEIEVQEGNGSTQPDFKEVRVYLSLYEDQDSITEIEGTTETQIMTIPAADFYTSEVNELPAYMIMIPTALVLETFPEDTEYTTPTFIVTRLECEMNDGTVYSTEDVGESIATGDFYQSPYRYNTIYIND
jgi:hypothetical protein